MKMTGIVRASKMPCRIDDGPQYDDDWVDAVEDMSAFEFLAAASARIPKKELLDWVVDALIDELDNNDHDEFKRLLEAVVVFQKELENRTKGDHDKAHRLLDGLNAKAGYVVNSAFYNAAKGMMKNEDVARRVYYGE